MKFRPARTSLFLLILFLSPQLYSQSYSGTNKATTKKVSLKSDDLKPLELEVEGVYDYGIGDSYAVRLVEKNSAKEWALIMIIGQCEATGIARSLYNQEFSRPLTYDLISSLFDLSSLKIKHIIITKLQDGTYYAYLVVNDNGKELQIDARPSDCMNIALKTGVPIYSNQKVWDDNKEKLETPQ
jgi:bifunctional DNase/RNase